MGRTGSQLPREPLRLVPEGAWSPGCHCSKPPDLSPGLFYNSLDFMGSVCRVEKAACCQEEQEFKVSLGYVVGPSVLCYMRLERRQRKGEERKGEREGGSRWISVVILVVGLWTVDLTPLSILNRARGTQAASDTGKDWASRSG